MMMMMIVIIPKERTANENAARIRVDQQPKDITYFSYKKSPPPVVGVWDSWKRQFNKKNVYNETATSCLFEPKTMRPHTRYWHILINKKLVKGKLLCWVRSIYKKKTCIRPKYIITRLFCIKVRNMMKCSKLAQNIVRCLSLFSAMMLCK